MSWWPSVRYLTWLLLLGALRLQAQTPPPTETLRGQLGIYVEDRFEQHFTATHYTLQTSSGNIELIFPSPHDAEGLTPGSDIEVTGHRQDSRFVIADDKAPSSNAAISRPGLRVLRRAAALPQAKAIGQRKIAIMLINFANQTAQPLTVDQAKAVFTVSNQFYQEASYQQYSLAADFYGYLTLPINETCSSNTSFEPGDSFTTITDSGRLAAKNAGIDLSPYESYVFLAPAIGRCAGGFASGASTPGLILIRSSTFYIAPYSALLSHELGHNLGLSHSHSFGCLNVVYNPALSCPVVEYGDLFDVMGAAPPNGYAPHFNSAYKEFLGWLTSRIVASSGTFEVLPFEPAPTGRALRLVPPSSTDSFYVEFRQPLGFDAAIPTYNGLGRVFTGALFHLSGNPAFVLNMHPADVYSGAPLPLDPSLHPGERYIDYANRLSVTTVSATPSALRLRILIPGLTSPTLLFVTPGNGAIVSGVANVSVDALDRGSIAKVEIYRDGTLIGTQNQMVNQAGTAGPAQYYTFAWDTTKDTSGSHTLTATAFNALDVSAMTDITVTVRKPPIVAISSPSDQTELTAVSSITLVAGVTTDNAAVQSVQFFANGNSLGFGSVNTSGGYSFTWTNVPAGTYAITATASDANGLASTSAPITITVHNPVVGAGGVVNGASLANGQAVTPGSLVSIFGSDLAPSGVGAGSIPLPNELLGVSVTMNGVTAPLAYVSSKQINAQVPWEMANSLGTVPLVVTRNGVPSPPQNVQLSSASPAIFTLQSGTGQAVAINSDGSFVGPSNSIPGAAAHPAKAGDTITVYATGLGAVTPAVQDGNNSSDELRKTTTVPTVLVGGVPCTVLFSGLSPQFVGVNQLNLTIAPGAPAGDAVPLQIQMGGLTSSGKVTIAVRSQ